MNTPTSNLHYEAPSVDCFKLSSPPLDLCVQFSGDADFETLRKGIPFSSPPSPGVRQVRLIED